MAKPLRELLVGRVLPPLALAIYRGAGATWRYVTRNPQHVREWMHSTRPVVGAFLHARSFPLLYYFSRPDRGRWIVMCSPSRDGDAMAYIESRLGFQVVRGSSGSGGARALVTLIKAQREDPGLVAGLSIDGSRGPRGIAQAGCVVLAQRTGGVILPMAASMRRCWVYPKSWDRIVIPKPFAEIQVELGAPIEVPRELDAAGLDTVRLRMEREVLELNRKLDDEVGFPDREPLQVKA